AREKGLSVDMAGFQQALNEQRNRSRAATTVDADDWTVVREVENIDFVGYDQLECATEIAKYRKITTKGKEQYQLVLAVTPFYAEGGGQVGDTGTLTAADSGERISITDTKKENGLIVHYASALPSGVEGPFLAKVDERKRRETEGNHSATHLL